MKCPRCIYQNPSSVKFYRYCGQSIGTLCLGCNTVNLPENDFSFQCRQLLPKSSESFSGKKMSMPLFPDVEKAIQHHPPIGERKYVTVLFSYLSGYTTPTQHFDHEEVKEIIVRLFCETMKVVTKCEGFIEKDIGDAVMAVFSAIRAHEDEPIQAIRSAIEIYELFSAFSSDYEKQIGQIQRCIPAATLDWLSPVMWTLEKEPTTSPALH